MNLRGTLAKSVLIILSLCSYIDCLNITTKNQSSELTGRDKFVEKYSLPGGNLFPLYCGFSSRISCSQALSLSAYFLSERSSEKSA
jgi:hypothetical protein